MAQVTTKKIRVFELAKTLGLETKAVLDYCRDLGYDVKNQLSSLETDQVEALKARIVVALVDVLDPIRLRLGRRLRLRQVRLRLAALW